MLSHSFKLKYSTLRTSICTILLLTCAPQLSASQGKHQQMSLSQLGQSFKKGINDIIKNEDDQGFRKLQLNELSKFNYDQSVYGDMPTIRSSQSSNSIGHSNESTNHVATGAPLAQNEGLNFYSAIQQTLRRHPKVGQSVANLDAQSANIRVARSGYYPQVSGGVSTGDMTTGERGRQLISLNVTQMLYDFGKVKSGVQMQEAQTVAAQAAVLVSIDQIALEVANAIVNIKRYQQLTKIAQQQLAGISRIGEIARLRAEAGISSQADPVQAQSYIESARSSLISQENQLRIYQERLRTLLGRDVSAMHWQIPTEIVKNSKMFESPEFNTLPQMIEALAAIEVAQLQKKQIDLSRYPTLSVKGSMSQALNGVNPNNNEDDGFYKSIMFEANSSLYEGGATRSRSRAAGYAEQAARARVDTVYLEVLNQIRSIQENVQNSERQMTVLANQQAISVRTKELYQEQYKLGTRTVLDLLNAEQSIHSANMQLENNRYDIYDNIVQFISVTGKSRSAYQLENQSIQGVEIQP